MRSKILILMGVAVASTAGCSPTPGADLEANKELIRRFGEVTNAADWDALTPIMTEDFARHSVATAGPPVTSRAEFIELQKSFLVSFPDQRVTLRDVVAEGDRVAVLAMYNATNTGPLGDIPATGKAVQVPFLAIFRIESGKIAELWAEWDNAAMLSQMDLFPPPPAE